jgi:hypothetical protein
VLGFPFDSTFGPSTKEMEENVVEKRLILRKKTLLLQKIQLTRQLD